MGARPRPPARVPSRRVRDRDGVARVGDRGARAGVLDQLLRPRRHLRPFRRPVRRLRRRDGRPRDGRRPVHDVRVLGAHVGVLVPAHRAQRSFGHGAIGGAAGTARDGWRRAVPARRGGAVAGRDGHDRLRRARRAAPGRNDRHHGSVSRTGRSVHEVGAVPVPLLAPRGHGRADPGECVPALGHDGEGRHRPDVETRTGVR